MNFFERIKFPVLTGFLFVVLLSSCEEEFTTIGADVIGGTPFRTSNVEYDVFAYNKKVNAVRTNKLNVYQLGVFNDPVYGKTEANITTQLLLPTTRPSFGKFSKDVEDNSENDSSASTIVENETVTEVYLYIPYLINTRGDRDGDGLADEYDADPEDSTSDTDGDGVSDNQERINGTNPLDEDTDGDGINDDVDDETIIDDFAKKVDIDSVYVNRSTFKKDTETSLNIKVERSTYFLRDLDPNTNFQEAQEYFSTQQFSPDFVSDVLFEGEYTVTNDQILVDQDDDPETEDVDESGIQARIEPGIRVPLDIAFFQTNLIDKEGGSELVSQANFNEFLRGIHISTSMITDDVMILLDMKDAEIRVTYTYDSINVNETTDDASDDEEEVLEGEFVLNMLREQGDGSVIGNAVNTFNNEMYSATINTAMNSGENASRIYVKGGAGTYTEIDLFAQNKEDGQTLIDQIKAENWIINEANLVFYVDRNALDNVGGTIEPPRLYLHNAETKAPLIDVATEISEQESLKLFGLYQNYDALLQKSTDGKGEKYKIRITDFINDIIIRDSTNATLGLSITPDIEFIGVGNAMFDDGEFEIPVTGTLSPLGTVLYGSVPENGEKRLKLEIFYTESE